MPLMKTQRVTTGEMKGIVVILALCLSASFVRCLNGGLAWCYHEASCSEPEWPVVASNLCNGTRQSPINIVSTAAQADPNLTPLNFNNFNSKSALTKIENTGRTVKVTFASGVSVSGGGLSEPYDGLQFHLHWGNGKQVPGSEHTVDGTRYPMELHIVTIKASHKGSSTSAVADPTGLATFGFFIDALEGNEPDKPDAWHTLASYLPQIQTSGTSVPMSAEISMNDLLVGVDLTKYYRYLGSLTTPNCNEAVVWTVFKDPVKISSNLIDLFSSTVFAINSTTTHMTNVYRKLQQSHPVTTQPAPVSNQDTQVYAELKAILQKLENKHSKQ